MLSTVRGLTLGRGINAGSRGALGVGGVGVSVGVRPCPRVQGRGKHAWACVPPAAVLQRGLVELGLQPREQLTLGVSPETTFPALWAGAAITWH